MTPPRNDLFDFMQSATIEMQKEYDRLQRRVKEDPGTAGDQGEENWATLLKGWLPSNFHIVTKGRIMGIDGTASPQVDIIILRPEYPPQLLDKKVYLAGGVLGAFECKTTLRREHITKVFENSIAIKSLNKSREGSPYKELHAGILYGVLAHSHSWKRVNNEIIDNISEILYEETKTKITHPRLMPDIICISNLCAWKTINLTFIGPRFIPDWHKMEPAYGPEGKSTVAYCHQNVEEKHICPIGGLISDLITKLAWEYPNLRPIADYYIEANIGGASQGAMNKYDADIFSESIRTQVINGMLQSGQRWNEWSQSFM